MERVEDIVWKPGMKVEELTKKLSNVGFQGTGVGRASDLMVKMKREGAKIFLTFTSNMVTSGLRGLFAQAIGKGMADVVVTTIGGLEEDMMKAKGDKFLITSFRADDLKLHEEGMNRVGNLLIPNDSYMKFEGTMKEMLEKLYQKKKRWSGVELFREIGLMLDDENSILYQAAKKDVPVFCPAITDGAFGFHLFMFQQDHPDFIVDVIQDFKEMIGTVSHDDKKGVIALGGGVSKHYAILGMLISGGADYAVYMTTARETSGSLSAATTEEAKSWGKISDNADAVTVNGEVSVLFPLSFFRAMDVLSQEGIA